MAKSKRLRKKRNFKKYSYRERLDFHTDRMRAGFAHPGKFNKNESFSAGFVHRSSDTSVFDQVKARCDEKSFNAGMNAGFKAYNKAVDHKF